MCRKVPACPGHTHCPSRVHVYRAVKFHTSEAALGAPRGRTRCHPSTALPVDLNLGPPRRRAGGGGVPRVQTGFDAHHCDNLVGKHKRALGLLLPVTGRPVDTDLGPWLLSRWDLRDKRRDRLPSRGARDAFTTMPMT